jgi:hypothetical protein
MFFDLRSVTIEQRRFDFCSEISFVRIRVSTIIEWCLRSSSYAIWFYLTVVLLFIVLSILKKVIGVVILVNLTLFLFFFVSFSQTFSISFSEYFFWFCEFRFAVIVRRKFVDEFEAFGIALTSKAVIGFCCLFQFLQFESYKRHRLRWVLIYLQSIMSNMMISCIALNDK